MGAGPGIAHFIFSETPGKSRVWSGSPALASSGLNQPTPQTNLDALVVQNVFGANGLPLGDAIVKAKSNIADPDVRRTFLLFGDPAMKVKQPNPTVH